MTCGILQFLLRRKEIDDNSEFERLFLLQAKKNIENIERYKVDFIYDYPFDENNYMESEKITKLLYWISM